MKTVRMVVRGRVQGVGYRDWTKREARRLGIRGWVRNRGDGSVELLAEGEEAALDELAVRCRRGPGTARVEALTVEPSDEEAPPGFERRPTC